MPPRTFEANAQLFREMIRKHPPYKLSWLNDRVQRPALCILKRGLLHGGWKGPTDAQQRSQLVCASRSRNSCWNSSPQISVPTGPASG